MADNPNLLLFTFVAGVTGFLLLWMIGSAFLGRRQAFLDRRVRSSASEPSIVLDDMVDRGGPRLVNVGRLKRQADDWAERIDMGMTGPEIWALVFLFGALLAAVVYFWRSTSGAGDEWLAVPAFLLGAGLPLAFFQWRQGVWRKRLQDQLPDMVFLMARSLRAGLSLDQSFRVLGDNGVRPLSREFSRMHNQLEVGLGLGQVLQNASQRIRLTDFNVFASVLSLYRATGGNLAVIMDRLAQTIRDHNQLRSYRRTATALGRVTVPIAALLVVLLLFYFFFYQRELAARYFDSTAGLVTFLVAMGLVGLGLLILYFLMRDDLS